MVVPIRLTKTLISLIRLLLCLAFLTAALSKLLAFESFTTSVSQIAGQSPEIARPISWIVIGVEAGIGIAFTLRRLVRPASVIAALLLSSFAVLLTSMVLQGREILCHCFGNMFPHLSLGSEIAVDLLLLTGAVFLFCEIQPHEWRGRSNESRRWRLMLLWSTTIVSILWSMIAMFVLDPAHSSLRIEQRVIGWFLESQPTASGFNVLLLADLDDFGCQLCLEDFVSFCDSLTVLHSSIGLSVQLLVKRDGRHSEPIQAHMLRGWAKGNGFTFPVLLDRDSVYERSGVRRTTLICVDGNKKVVMQETFPLGPGRREEILHQLSL